MADCTEIHGQQDESAGMTTIENRDAPSNLSKPMLGKLNDNVKENIPTLSQTICDWRVWTILFYIWILGFAVIIPILLAPVIGTNYFNGNSSTYGLYYGIFSSIGGFVGFTTQGYIGQISDMYGRKYVLIFTWFTMAISQGCFNFTHNIWYWLILIPIQQFSFDTLFIPLKYACK